MSEGWQVWIGRIGIGRIGRIGIGRIGRIGIGRIGRICIGRIGRICFGRIGLVGSVMMGGWTGVVRVSTLVGTCLQRGGKLPFPVKQNVFGLTCACVGSMHGTCA